MSFKKVWFVNKYIVHIFNLIYIKNESLIFLCSWAAVYDTNTCRNYLVMKKKFEEDFVLRS